MSEELRGEVVLADPGHVHQVQASPRHLPVGDLPALRVAEGLLLTQLALLPDYVSAGKGY